MWKGHWRCPKELHLIWQVCFSRCFWYSNIFCWGQFSLWEIKKKISWLKVMCMRWESNLNHAAVHQEALHCHSSELPVVWDCVKLTYIHLPPSPIIWVKCSWSSINFRVIWWSLATSLWSLQKFLDFEQRVGAHCLLCLRSLRPSLNLLKHSKIHVQDAHFDSFRISYVSLAIFLSF